MVLAIINLLVSLTILFILVAVGIKVKQTSDEFDNSRAGKLFKQLGITS